MPTVTELLNTIRKQPAEHYGLRWRPTLGHQALDDLDYFGAPFDRPHHEFPPQHFTLLDRDVLEIAFLKVNNPKLIVEIGVDRSENFDNSSTAKLLRLKSPECTYVGIDINDKSYLKGKASNVYTLQNSSSEHQKLYDLMGQLSLNQIDFMFVDGWHSINAVLSDWKYWEKMAPTGIMAFHDINYHPGPIAVLDAADPTIFDVTYYGRDIPLDWGMGVVKRRKESI